MIKTITIPEAIRLLADSCDGAHAKDGMGFNKADSGAGKHLAARPDGEWGNLDLQKGFQLTRVYRGQLGGYEILPPSKHPQWCAQGARVWYVDVADQHCRLRRKRRIERDADVTRLKFAAACRISRVGDRIVVRSPYNQELVNDLRAVRRFGLVYDGKSRTNWLRDDNVRCAEALLPVAEKWDFFGQEILEQVTEAARVAADLRAQEEREREERQAQARKCVKLAMELYPFQREGVDFLVNTPCAFLADEMGLGKTCQSIASIEERAAFPALVLCPASLKINWSREIAKWTPHRTVQVVKNGKTKIDPNADWVVVNYDLVKAQKDRRGWWQAKPGLTEDIAARKNVSVICDESHYLKSGKAQRTQAVRVLVKGADIRILLSGTPIKNRPSELISQLQILGQFDGLFGDWNAYVRRYCNYYRDRFGAHYDGATNLGELHEKLKPCFLRRKKETVLPDLPPKSWTRLEVPLPPADMRVYKHARDELLAFLRETQGNEAAQRAAHIKHLAQINTLRQIAAAGKLKAAKEWVGAFLAADRTQKLVIFAHHIAVQDALVEAFPGCARVKGGTSAETKQQAVDAFQDDPDVRIIVCSLQAGGVGITLTSGSNVLFVEKAWTPADIDQAADRCHRIGQHDNVTCWSLVGVDTIDEWLEDLLQQKWQIFSQVVEGQKKVDVKEDVLSRFQQMAAQTTKRKRRKA